MRSLSLLILLISLTTSLKSQNRYDFKSMKIVYKSESVVMNGVSKSSGTKTVWIDDFGAKEAEESLLTSTVSVMGESVVEKQHTLSIVNGKMAYSVDMISKTGMQGDISQMQALAMAMSPSTVAGMEIYQGKDGLKQFVIDNGGIWHGEELFLNKKCEVYTLMNVKVWTYKGIVLKSESDLGGNIHKEEATSLEENVAIDAKKFQVPVGIQMSNYDAQMTELEFNNPTDGSMMVLNVGITFAQFVTAVSSISINSYSTIMNNESEEAYTSMFTIGKMFGSIMVVNLDNFELMAATASEFKETKRYSIGSHSAIVGRNVVTDEEEVEMNVLLVKFPEKDLTVLVSGELGIEISLLESIVKQLKF